MAAAAASPADSVLSEARHGSGKQSSVPCGFGFVCGTPDVSSPGGGEVRRGQGAEVRAGGPRSRREVRDVQGGDGPGEGRPGGPHGREFGTRNRLHFNTFSSERDAVIESTVALNQFIVDSCEDVQPPLISRSIRDPWGDKR